MMTLSVFECIIKADLLHQLWVVVVHDMNLCRGFIRDALFIYPINCSPGSELNFLG